MKNFTKLTLGSEVVEVRIKSLSKPYVTLSSFTSLLWQRLPITPRNLLYFSIPLIIIKFNGHFKFPGKKSEAHRSYSRTTPRKQALFFIKTLFTVTYIQSVPIYIHAIRIFIRHEKDSVHVFRNNSVRYIKTHLCQLISGDTTRRKCTKNVSSLSVFISSRMFYALLLTRKASVCPS